MLRARCSNDNHGRSIVTVRFCSTCGVMLNERVRPNRCEEASHARMRRVQSSYCVDCGESLFKRR